MARPLPLPRGRGRVRSFVGIGAGGHARCVIEALWSARGRVHVAALLDDDPALHGTEVLGIPVIGGTECLLGRQEGPLRRVGLGFVGVGGAGDTGARRLLHDRLAATGLGIPPIAHASAQVARSARLRGGAQVMAGAVVNARAEICEDALVGARAVVGHDAVVGRHAHVASGAVIDGSAVIGPGAHVGSRVAVLEGRVVGAGAVVGSGAVVVDDVPAGAVVVGIPARRVRRPEPVRADP